MKHFGNRVEDVKICYIGGGSRGWAWGLMSDLARESSMSGTVSLYDIDYEAAKTNEIIGNKVNVDCPDAPGKWSYKAEKNIEDALKGADFVVISILPGTFDEMESDVHTPEKYGIYQSVGDTVGAGGIIRALRTIPMYEVIANAIKENCPDAWVINYTNPMTMCVRTLYKVFPKIKAFGCCHEVFGTQKLLARCAKEMLNVEEEITRDEIRVNVYGINHFTWLDKAHYKNIDLLPYYKEYCIKHFDDVTTPITDDNWANRHFISQNVIHYDLFLKYGVIAAAGDRHLAEFVPNKWYLKDPETVEKWKFALTTVAWRKEELKERLARSKRLASGEEKFKIKETGEEGVKQMKALLGLGDFVTNVNVPNVGQIPNLPLGAVVETNAHFTTDDVRPVTAGSIPNNVLSLMYQTVLNQETVVEAGIKRDLDLAFTAFTKDPQVETLSLDDAKKLFDEMVENTSKYLTEYKK